MNQDENIINTNILYENRELSWLKFNERVLEEARDKRNPLCERMNFLSIFQTNLDEFFMVRVGSLEDQKLLKDPVRENKTNMTPKEQIDAVLKRVKELDRLRDDTYESIIDEVGENGINIVKMENLSRSQTKGLLSFYKSEVLPLLSVMIVGRKQPFPFLKGKEIYAVANLSTKGDKEKIGLIPCTASSVSRLVKAPKSENTFVLLEDMILYFMADTFKEYKINEKALIRLTRNADIDVVKVYDEELDYREHMAQIVKQRKKLAPVRLEVGGHISNKLLCKVCEHYDLTLSQIFEMNSPLDLSFFSTLADNLRKDASLVYERRIPQPSCMIEDNKPVIPQILEKDILLTYPFESIKPFLNMLREAAVDPEVISIRMTLYRLAKNSKVVEALVDAAENGKQVDVLVELKARFDEENNIEWSRRLEDAGCHVVYGVDGLKVHSKLCLITRKTNAIEYITQIGTGNYNESTSRFYTDYCLMTADKRIGEEAAKVFNALLLGTVVEDTKHLLVAPKCLQDPVVAMIDEEISYAKKGEPAYIGIKINSLTDKRIIDKLIEASRAGVKIDMVIRGICCLRSQVPENTDNIRVMSIVGRYLEHSRIYIFGPEKREKIYIASADFMTRNTLRRVEVATPIYDEAIRERIRQMFQIMLKDNVKGRIQQADGSYVHVVNDQQPLDSQAYFYDKAYEMASKNETTLT